MRTTPDDDVDEPYELTAMNSSCVGTRDRAGQVGDEHDRALEHRDQQQILAVGGDGIPVVGAQLSAQFGDPCLDLILGEQHRLDVAGIQLRGMTGTSTACHVRLRSTNVSSP